ncbi:App1 family protein [Marinivivus vitaminiproducens]|uniref:App1 family protein n=1 Tax=Marinivivus vitaminiproducens TaxID=3035935 RepID=UPI0027A5EEBB|nr:DUF2183 domain-containing protein [Geminicoccaceae bacterium SCSIO 64248]
MTTPSTPARLQRAVRQGLRLLTRPVRMAKGRGGIAVQAYRGYGSARQVFLIGRVFRQPEFGARLPEGTLGRILNDLGRRLLRRGVGEAILIARLYGGEQYVRTDKDGYFRINMNLLAKPYADLAWHGMELELIRPVRVRTQGIVFIPSEPSRFVVISDIDDTIMHTGVASKAKMLWHLFAKDASSRTAFPGMAALLRALYRGPDGADMNPMLYVSRAPWSIYEVLDEFFNMHRIPVGPLLFLREWGLTLQRPLPRQAKGHKMAVIRSMMEVYHDLPVVLIGDSGQRDAEVYTQIVREQPGRVLAIYIRNVSEGLRRPQAIGHLARDVERAGSTMVLAEDSEAIARHAVEHGLIPEAAMPAVRGEIADAESGLHPTVTAPAGQATQDAEAANVVVESEPERRRHG